MMTLSPEPAPVVCDGWEMRWLGPLLEDGRRHSQAVRRDTKAIELLAACGGGERPWDLAALTLLAEHMRQAPEVVHDHVEGGRETATEDAMLELLKRFGWREGDVPTRLKKVEKRARQRYRGEAHTSDPDLDRAVARLAKWLRKAAS